MKNKSSRLVWCLALVSPFILAMNEKALADSEGQQDPVQKQEAMPRDPRMPPVIPGEEVTTANGEKIKVWSSSGPVYVDHPPVNQDSFANVPPVGVIVDDRPSYDHGHDHDR